MAANDFKLKVQAVLDKIQSIANIRTDIKAIEPKLPKMKIQGTLDSTATRKELNTKLKSVKPKVKVDTDITQAEKKIKKIGQQKNETTITPTVDNTQVVSGLKKAQKETKSLWERFTTNIFGSNLIRMGTQKVIQAVHEAILAIKELDTLKTDIQMVSGSTDSEVNAMMSSYNAMAKELSSTTKEVSTAANEFLKMGESVANTNELIKNATILSKVGMIDSADAASYLISSMRGYQVAAEDSIDIVNKLTSVDLEAAVSAGGLAEAISCCSNIANNSGTSMNRLIGYAASIGEVTQESMSVVGSSLKSMYSRMNNIKIGRFIDDETGESLSDTEAVLNKLGIQLRDTQDTYRNFDDVLDDVGKNWEDFTQVEQNAISVAIAGTLQRERFIALMNNYSSALEYSEVAANSAGSALERYGVYQDSIEAKTNELTAAIESLSTNVVSEELYGGIIEATTGIVEFLDKTNLLKGTLAGLIAMGASKAIVSIGTGFVTAAKNTAQLSAAMELFDKGRDADNLRDIGAACKGLNNNQLKLILSTKGLRTEQRLNILEGMDMEEQEQKQMLTTLGFSAAEDKAAISTFSLGTAMSALKTAMVMNPIGAFVTAVSAITIAFSVYKQHQEEVRRATEEAANAYKESASSVDDYVSKYQELHKALIVAKGNEEETYNVKKQLLELQTELNDKFGDEYGAINLVTDAYKDQTEAIKILNKEAAQTFLNENRKGIDKAEKEMTKVRHYSLSYTGISAYSEKGEILKEIAEKYKNQGIDLFDESGDGSYTLFSVYLNADAQSAYDTINAFENDIRDKAKELGDEHMFEDVLDMSSSSLNYARSIIDEYGNIFQQALTAEIVSDDDKSRTYDEALKAVEAYNEAVLKSENPYDDQNVIRAKEELDAIKTSIQDNKEEWGKYSRLLDDVFGQADTRLLEFNEALKTDRGIKELANDLEGLSDLDLQALDENVGGNESFDKLKEAAAGYKVNADELIDALIRLGYVQGEIQNTVSVDEPISLSISETIDQLNTQLKPVFDSLKSAYQNIFTDDGFTPDNVDIPMLESIKSSIEEINKLENVDINIDIGAFDKLATTLADVNTREEQAKQAFNDFATEIYNASTATDGMTEETVQMVEQLLESLGVVNAEEVALNALSEAKARAIIDSYDLANATEEDIAAMLSEAQAAGITAAEIFQLVAAKQVFNNQGLNPKEKVEKLKELANAYGQTAIAARIANMEIAAEKGHISIDYEKELAAFQNEINSAINNVQIDFSGVTKSAGGAGKDAGDAYVDAFEKELKALDELKAAGFISEKEYLDRLRVLYERYFKDKLGYEKEFAKYQKQYLDGYKSLYESVFSHATKVIDDRIDAINDEKDAAIDSLEAQKQAAEDSYNAQITLLEKKKDALQDEIDQIKEANEDRKEAIDLQKAEYELERMQNQRTILQYSEEKGMHYVTDTSGIRDAKNDLDDKKADAKIRNLEKQQDALDKQIESFQEMLDASNEYWDEQIEQVENYYDTMVKGLEEYRKQWEELSDLQEHAEMIALLKELGFTEEDLLNQGSGAFETLRTSYLGILKDLNEGNQGVLDGLSKLANVDMSSIPSFLSETKGYIDSIANMDVTALSDGLSDVSNGFSNIADSASSAASAISGGGGNTVPSSAQTASGGETSSSTSGGNSSSLTDAIKEVSTDSVKEINKISDAFAGEKEEGTSVTSAIQKVMDKIGTVDSDKESSDSLMSTLKEQTEAALDEEKGIPAQKTAWEELNKPLSESVDLVTTLQSTLEDMNGEKFTVTLNVEGNGLPDSIVSEFGGGGSSSPSHGGGGHSRVVGNAEVKGNEEGWTILSDGRQIKPLQPGDKTYDMLQKFNAYFRSIDNNVEDFSRHIVMEQSRQAQEVASQITNSSSVVNNNRNVQPVVNQNITLNCPNVTNNSGVEYIQKELGHLSLMAIQEPLRSY